MKVDMTKVKKGSSELTPECLHLINEISQCNSSVELLNFLEKVKVWVYGKCELYHWINTLDRFDGILEEAAKPVNGNEHILQCDVSFSEQDVRLLLSVLHFTTLLIEHSFSRHLYNSIEHLTELLSSGNMDIVLAILNLLYMFSKRSNFIPRLSLAKKDILLRKLFNIAERWGDPNNGLSLIDCCLRKPKDEFLNQLFIEYVNEKGQRVVLEIPNMKSLCQKYSSSEVVKILCEGIPNPPEEVKMRIAHRVRLVSGFRNLKLRLQFVQARLQAISVLIYSNALQDNVERVLYTGIGEELCELIDRQDKHLIDIRAAVLRTLTSMLHFDRNPNIPRPGSRLSKIIYYTGAERQTGMLPRLVKDCISNLTSDVENYNYPLALATSLFSLLYHLASYESGGQALIKSGMMQSLLRVISWTGVDLEHITFVTRAVRVIDLITNIDIAKFHQNNGINIFIDRLEKEVSICREVITRELVKSQSDDTVDEISNPKELDHESDDSSNSVRMDSKCSAVTDKNEYPEYSSYAKSSKERLSNKFVITRNSKSNKIACVTQRAALLKSILNFVKKSIQDHAHFNGTRNIMETSLPNSLHHIIFNAEFYGPSLFLLATDVIIVYVFNEPSLLSSLQDSGLTKVILQSLLEKEVPATREVLASLPNVFSALCLNERGLMEFMSYNPFDKLLKVLLSPDYLVAMRRRRSSDPLGDTSTNLGNAMDDLMKHHPYLRTDATEAIVRLLNELVRLGSDINYICWRANKDNNANCGYNKVNITGDANHTETARSSNNFSNTPDAEDNGNDSSGDDDEDDDEVSSVSQQQTQTSQMPEACMPHGASTKIVEREPIPLIDYILNVMKFIEAIFSNSSNGENCREFVLYGGLKPLLQLLSLPNLPVDSPISTTALAVANVAKSILNVSHETKVIDISLQQLLEIVDQLEPLILQFDFPNGSILFRELLSCPNVNEGFSNAEFTPLLHKMSAVHGYVVMLVHLCRNASNDMRSILLRQWGSEADIGLRLLQKLVKLYISLVWESTILLNMCSEESLNQTALSFSWSNMMSFPIEVERKNATHTKSNSDEARTPDDHQNALKSKVKLEDQLRCTKCLLAASSRLGRALAELFGTLVKLSVGSPQSRPRRVHDFVTNISSSKYPTPEARSIARVLSSILVNGFCHENLKSKPAAKLKLTFLICSVGFTGPMLFDDKRNAFHLMISQFYQQNGIKAFFEMFYWALSINNSPYNMAVEKTLTIENILEDCPDDNCEFPEGSGEFLYAWLQLLEKMVNPIGILDSPYEVSPQAGQDANAIQFEPIFYLIQVHNFAIHAVRRLWNREPIANYGILMTTTIMTILKHIVKPQNFFQEQFQARINEIHNKNQTIKKHLEFEYYKEGGIFRGNLRILIDMGFERYQVLEALRSTSSLEQAMDYLLNRSENSEILDNVCGGETSFSSSSSKSNKIDGESELPSPTAQLENKLPTVKTCPQTTEIFLIPDDIFNKFCDEIIEKIFQIMEKYIIPDIINVGSELISVLYRRRCQHGKKVFIDKLVCDLQYWCGNVTQSINDSKNSCELKDDCIVGSTATKLQTRLKVFTLLLEETYIEFRKEFCKHLLEKNCLSALVSLLIQTETMLTNQSQLGAKKKIPLWLHNIIEFIDSVDSASLILQRKANVESITNDVWKWYDISNGKWNTYSEANNAIIQKAFNSGERSVNINIGRQRYTMNFNCMTHLSEASGSHRPVLPSLKLTDLLATMRNDKTNLALDCIRTYTVSSKPDGTIEHSHENLFLKSIFNTNDSSLLSVKKQEEKRQSVTVLDESYYEEKENNIKKKGFYSGKGAVPIRKKYLSIVLNEESVGLSKLDNNSFIICLIRLLQHGFFLQFDTQLAILKLCSRLTKNYKNAEIFFKNGGLKLLLKMRQSCGIMAFPTYAIIIIRHLLEAPKVLQETFEQVLTLKTSQQIPASHRDVLFALTQMSSAVSRNPTLFLSTAKQILQWDCSSNLKFSLDHSKFLIKAAKTKKMESKETHSEENLTVQSSVKVVKELLKAVIQPCIHYGGVSAQNNTEEVKLEAASRNESPRKEDANRSQDKFEQCCCSWHIPCSGRVHHKPVISRSTLLKILVDSVRSYQTLVPRLIASHVYYPKDSTLIKHEQSFLSFVLDNFLPIVRPQQISEVSVMTRVLVSSLADCYTQIGVQTKVVDEVQSAIKRALILPDSPEKHTRIQVLVGLLPVMIDSPVLSYKNYMFETLIRKGVMTSLIKIAQYTDLSNQKTISTVQSILRPMDILLRIAVSPITLSSQNVRIIPTNSVLDRRLFPRTTRSNWYNSTEEDETLRTIIRNVFSERRQAFDFIFNNDDTFSNSADSQAVVGSNTDNDTEETNTLMSFNNDQELDFDRLWNNLLQNENLRAIEENVSVSTISENMATLSQSDHEHLDNDDNDDAHISGTGCSSDGASTSSENTPAIIDNQTSILGEASTSETDSDSNVSTENEDIIDEDDNDEPEECTEERNENNGNTRQYIEVFDNVYVPESSETASNDPDIDAEDDVSDIGGTANIISQDSAMDNNSTTNFMTRSAVGPIVGQQISSTTGFMTSERNSSEHSFLSSTNNSENSNTITCGISPYLSFVETDEHLNYRQTGDIGVNALPVVESSSYRREGTRRLVFLDQQYCTQMPTFSNATEEGQIETFNQDALHWWLEEAKYSDPETHMDACLQVAHHLIVHLIKVKDMLLKRKTELCKSECKKSSIPVPTQSSSSSLQANVDMKKLDGRGDANESAAQKAPSDTLEESNNSFIDNEIKEEEEFSKESKDIEQNSTSITEEEPVRSVDMDCGSNENSQNTLSETPEERADSLMPNLVRTNVEINTVTEPPPSNVMAVEFTDMNLNETPAAPKPETQEANVVTTQASTSASSTRNTELTPEIQAVLGDLEIPEGVDPSFLAALPTEMREEVIQEHIRMQRFVQRPQNSEIQSNQYTLSEVSPEFLAALPPNIQTEVLMQQRIEQQRQAAQSTNPEDPVDTAAFFQNLPETLRQAILADMEDSQISSLPPDLAAEAQHLRRDWESRNGARLDMQRNPINGYLSSRLSASSQNLNEESRWQNNTIWSDPNGLNSARHQRTTVIHQQQNCGKPLTLLLMEDLNNLPDPDTLSTLLLFLFIEDSKFSYTRLHRIIRNICYHVPIRNWIINALINIIEYATSSCLWSAGTEIVQPQWLKLKVDAAFGFKSNTFILNKCQDDYTISINPQASQQVVKNCLDILFALAKQFPKSFLPVSTERKQRKRHLFKGKEDLNIPTSMSNLKAKFGESRVLDEYPSTSKAVGKSQKGLTSGDFKYNTNSTDFWKVLLNTEIYANLRFSRTSLFPLFSQPPWEWKATNSEFISFNDSAFAKLLDMLSFKIIRRSPQLTDLLLKLLASLSSELPEEDSGVTDASKMEIKSYFKKIHPEGELQQQQEEDSKTDNTEDSKDKIKQHPKLYSKMFPYFVTLIEVLTHKCGTNEGLENMSKLIFNMCQCSHYSNVVLSYYLRSAIMGLAEQVQNEIKALLDELLVYHNTVKFNTTFEYEQKLSCLSLFNGLMQDRFTAQPIVISSPSDPKPACELQLSAIKYLLSPLSAQLYFLRTLKIFIQINNLLDAHNNWYRSKQKLCLSEILSLNELWSTLSKCLVSLEESKDEYAVLVLQPTVEAFFLIHASYDASNANNSDTKCTQPDAATNNLSEDNSKDNSTQSPEEDAGEDDFVKSKLQCDRQKFLQFAEKHRTVLNQILRQSPVHLSDGPFAVLVDHTRILDFDVKRKYFHTELERIDEGVRREENTVSVRRASVFEDSFRALYRLTPEEWKNRFYIVFEDEEGQDAGGLLREWYIIISREIFNPMYALFCVSPGDRVTYMINPSSHANPNHLSYFKFVGRLIAKAIHDNKLLECYFTRAFYKHILGKQVKHTDMESQDYEFYKGLDYLMKNDITTLGYELTFSTEVQEFGVTQVRDLIPNGRNIPVTEENKFDYVQLVCQLKMSGSIRQQFKNNVDGVTNYIQWFWRALRSFDQADRAKFLQFVTGTSKVPLQGFGSLEGMNGIQKFQIHRDDRSTDRLPCAHTCFNQLDLPMYKSYEKLRSSLLKAIHECSEGFGFA
uniref:HECT-type E3 ubiquitin transferase n=1 Tax=Glossina pallidipes TaxID=7398 RepID=A0A1A9ZLS0_GLOPL